MKQFEHYSTAVGVSPARQRELGFVHVLLLVLVVLGIGMWGVGELLERVAEQKQAADQTSNTNMEEARRALFDYALIAPSGTEALSLPGHFNAYRTDSDNVPFRRFSLPCPDVAGGDLNLDGVSDILENGCAAGFVAPLLSGATFGRLPWREFSDAVNGSYEFVRGVGGKDFRDVANQRLWYGLSGNLADVETPLNPHALLRMTTGWLTVQDTSNAAVVTLSDRVAAVVISPGQFGGDDTGARIAEALLYRGDGAPVSQINAASVAVFHQAYLQTATYSALNTGVIAVNVADSKPYADRLEYLTIEDLAADDGDGIALLEATDGENIYDILTGNKPGYVGIADLWQQHLQRFGYLPEPAMFDDNSASSRNRLSGPPSQLTVRVSYPTGGGVASAVLPFQQGAMISSTMMVSVVMRISDLPPVYLAAGAGIAVEQDSQVLSPPYNLPLADLKTALNDIASLPTAVSANLIARQSTNHYPANGLFGLNNTVLVTSGAIVPATIVLDTPLDITIRSGNIFPVVLAEAAYGYFEKPNLSDIVVYPNSPASDIEIDKLPPYAGRVLLPAGTFLTLSAANVILRLPANFEVIGSYDPVTRQWIMDNPTREPVIFDGADNKELITVVGIPNGWAVESGDMGMLPIEEVSVTAFFGSTLSLSAGNAISELAVEFDVYTETNITLVPFPPPGRPVLEGNAVPLPTPVVISANTEFNLPAGGRIIYPFGASFSLGDGFSFPPNAIVQYPAGAVVEVQLPANAVLPSGRRLANPALITNRITLNHGGMVKLTGARPVFGEGAVVSARQQSFDIELRSSAVRNGVDVRITVNGGVTTTVVGPVTTTLASGQVVQPFTGRTFSQPPEWVLPDGAILAADSRVQAKFLTHPRYAIVREGGRRQVIDSSGDNRAVLSDVRLLFGQNNIGQTRVSITVSFSEDSDFSLPGGFRFTLQYDSLTVFSGAQTVRAMSIFALPEDTAVFDPDVLSQLFEAGGVGSSGQLTVTLVGGARLTTSIRSAAVLLSEKVTLQLALPVGGASALTVNRGDRGVIENRLVLMPDTDMYVFIAGAVSVIEAGSIVDLMSGGVYPPVGVQRVRRVSGDRQIRSAEAMHIYFSAPATLRADLPELSVSRDLALGTDEWLLHSSPVRAGGISVRHISYASGAAVVGTLAIVTTAVIPTGAYIIIPAGEGLDFISSEGAPFNAGVQNSDYANLPDSAVLVIPPDSELVVDSTTRIRGPGYIGLGQNGAGAAIVGHSSYISDTPPLVFLSESGFLFDEQVAARDRQETYIPISSAARLDINGYMEKRSDSGFYADFMPINNASFLRDFPIMYAVAPECREAVSPGVNCAEGEGEGLVVSLQVDEEYVLREDLVTPSSALLTSNLPGLGLVVEGMQINGAPSITIGVGALLINANTGAVSFLSPSSAYTPQPNDQLVVRVADSLIPTELRSYFDVASFSDSLDGKHYAALDGELTIYVGGYTGAPSTMAVGAVALTTGNKLNIGVEGKLAGIDGINDFGSDSSATLNFGRYQTEVDLSEYAVLNPTDYGLLSLTLSADAAQIGLGGALYRAYSANAVVSISGGRGTAIAISDSGFALISVDAGSEIPMLPGYLWQGYLPAVGATLAFTRSQIADTYTLFADQSGIGRAGDPTWPPASVYLRVQSTVQALHSWGSGQELPEGLDGLSQINSPPVTNTLVNHTLSAGGVVSYDAGIRQRIALTVTDIGKGVGLSPATPLVALTYDAGFLASVAVQTIGIRVRHLDSGDIAVTNALWRPIAYGTVVRSGAIVTTTINALRWNRKNNPLPGGIGGAFRPDASQIAAPGFLPTVSNPGFIDSPEVARQGQLDLVGSLTLNNVGNNPVWSGRLVETADRGAQNENAYIDGFMCNGVAATAVFNPPHYQMLATDSAPMYTAWNFPAAGAYANVTTVVVPGRRTGATGFNLELSQVQRSVHTPATVLISGFPPRAPTSPPTAVTIGAAAVMVTVNSDLVFYLDRAYNIGDSGVLMQTLRFGDNFNLSGPGAIVPPFGANNTLALAHVFAERSNLMNAVLGYTELSPLYDDGTGTCGSGRPCEEMYDNADWQPVLNGVLSFDGVNVSIVGSSAPDRLHEEVRFILPQPQAVVTDTSGKQVTVYAGSIIYPRRNLILSAKRLREGAYDLHLTEGEAYAAIDVSPAINPKPVYFYRDVASNMKSGDFNYAPIRVETAAGDICVVEPLGFANNDVVDFRISITTGFDGVTVAGDYSGGGITLTSRYDGTYTRGYLLDDDGVELITTYYRGERLADSGAFSPYSNNPSVFDSRLLTIGGSVSVIPPLAFTTTLAEPPLPLYNTDIPFANPLAYRWTSSPFGTLYSGTEYPFLIPLGSDPFPNPPVVNSVAVLTTLANGRTLTITVPNRTTIQASVELVLVTNHLVGLQKENHLVGVFQHTDGNEFLPLRFAHRINIPQYQTLSFFGYTGDLAYPIEATSFFEFPPGSSANVLNVDGGSWVASHPYLARYAQGLEISHSGTTLTIAQPFNDGYRSIDIGGRRVLHYQRSESIPGNNVFSAAPVYTNVWIRLPKGGRLVNRRTGQVVSLEENSMLNPILGTYITFPNRIGGTGVDLEVDNGYLTEAVVNANITLVRPALTIPAGARLFVGDSGGVIRNVKAIAMFSLSPLESVDCPTGAFSVLDGQSGAPIAINQLTEGVTGNNYTGQDIGIGHPCLWLDDPENTDGDRFYLYRSRRRYASDNLKARVVSNDRTYVLGGKIELTIP